MKKQRFIIVLLFIVTVNLCKGQSLNFIDSTSWVDLGDIDVQGDQLTVEA